MTAGLAAGALIAVPLVIALAGAEPLDVIASSVNKGPIALTARPVEVALNATQGGALAERLAVVKSGQSLRLTLSGQRTNVQPEVLYEVYLGLPPGAVPSRNSSSFVGTFNFFNTVLGAQADSRAALQAGSLGFSYDVTDLVASLRARKLVGDAVNVTIVPAGPPHAGAQPVIGEIALVLE